MLWVKYFASVLILFIFLTPGYAQEEPPPLDLNHSLLISIRLGEKTKAFPKHEAREITKPSNISLDLHLRIDTPLLPDYWSKYANLPHERVITNYKGLRGVIYKQIESTAQKYYNRMLRTYWNQDDLHPIDLNKKFSIQSNNYGHQWWAQSPKKKYFFDYYPKEKGGARVSYLTIGEKYEIFSLGPLYINNTGRIGWSGWKLSISHEDDGLKLKDKLKSNTEPIGNIQHIQTSERKLSFGISPPTGNIYSGDFFTISGSVKFNLRVDKINRNGSSIKGQIRIIGLHGYRNIPWIYIYVKATVKPFKEEYNASILVSLLQW